MKGKPMDKIQKISPFLWFDDQAEEAVTFYLGIFRNSKINKTARYSEAGREFHHKEPGSVMTIAFELEGQPFTALNGGPMFKFSQAISFVIKCQTQDEIDHYWDKLSEGGDAKARQCGWLKDKFGVSWQVVPNNLSELLGGSDPAKSQRAMQALLRMKKLKLEELQRA
jgi:predicted 3-demethylubiquinone-9 3-methyltransferase (glyoxalase superfamily)